jgi:hypothetical protein
LLRNTKGHQNASIGFGNEKALNQLLAHHSVIFKPESRMVWVSSNPYQLGAYVAYDLNEIFSNKENDFVVLGTNSKTISSDVFLESSAYRSYEKFRILDRIVDSAIRNKTALTAEDINQYRNCNSDFWLGYYKIGVYYFNKGYYLAAKQEFQTALKKEITTVPDRIQIENYLKRIKSKTK